MTEAQKKMIREYRLKGVGYRAIGSRLGIPRDTVRDYCKQHGLFGSAEVAALNAAERMGKREACAYCFKPIQQKETGQPRKFCSEQCRKKWWKEHPEAKKKRAYYQSRCRFCGKSFVAFGARKRTYCTDCKYLQRHERRKK